MFEARAKKIIKCLTICTVLLCLPVLSSSSFAKNAATRPSSQSLTAYVEGEVIVAFKRNLTQAKIDNIIRSNGGKASDKIKSLNVYRLKIKGDVKRSAKRYRGVRGVKYAEPDFRIASLTTPNDSLFSSQWAPVRISAPAAWDIERGLNNPVVVAVIDTGVDKANAELGSKIVSGYDFVNNDLDAVDDNGHGTHVAAIAAAETNNAQGIAGISWGAKVMPVKVLDMWGSGTTFDACKGILFAADNGAKVINMSFGGSSYSVTERDSVDYAYNKGVTLIAAAGNSSSNTYLYPAALDNVISIAATDPNDLRAGFSTFNDKVDLAAPGVSIISSVLHGQFESWSGTSMASPHAAGLAALILSQKPAYSPAQVELVMEKTADDVNAATYPGYDIYIGAGRINAANALADGLPLPPMPQTPPTPPAPEPPIATIIIPASGQTVSGTIDIEGRIDDSATGGQRITDAEIAVDMGSSSPMNAKDGAFDSSLESVVSKLDTSRLGNGNHTIYVRGRDSGGLWSNWAAVTVLVRNDSGEGLIVKITYPTPDSPQPGFFGVIGVTGIAKHLEPAKFAGYKLEYQKNHSSANAEVNDHEWTLITTSTTAVDNGSLGSWDANGLQPGMYKLRLTGYDIFGNSLSDTEYLRILNKER